MSKYEECLEELEESLPEYIRTIGEFQHENKKWQISNHYFVEKPDRCQICGHYPIKEIFEITSTGNILKVGNVCINKITNTKIGKWYKTTYKKIEQLKQNKSKITIISGMLKDYENDTLPFSMSSIACERFEKMLDRLCNGLNLTKSQDGLFYAYIRKAADYLESAEE